MRKKELAAMQRDWQEEVAEDNDTPAEIRLKTVIKKVMNAQHFVRELRNHGRPKASNDAMITELDAEQEIEGEKNIYSEGLCFALFSSNNITRYLFLPALWRNAWQNWANMVALGLSWHSLLSVFLKSMIHGEDAASKVTDDEVLVHIATVGLLWVRFLQYMKGTGLNFATFILMLEEISWNIQMFLIIFFLMLVMFAMLYHILLVDADLDDDTWNLYVSSTWNVWLFALGNFDDTAYPTTDSQFVFTFFALAVVVVMMNVLIAIVSDSYTDAMSRSTPLFWRSRLELVAEYEPLMRAENSGITADGTENIPADEIAARGLLIPTRWQHKALEWQEGNLITLMIFGIVIFELMVSLGFLKGISDAALHSINTLVSLFFLIEITFRYYNWCCCYSLESRNVVGGFFTNPYRLLDTSLLVVDLIILAFMFSTGSERFLPLKAGVKFARVSRVVRTAKWMRGLKAFRSCHVVSKGFQTWRVCTKPTRKHLLEAIKSKLKDLEDESNWAGRSIGITQLTKSTIQRSTAKLVKKVQEIDEINRARCSAIEKQIEVTSDASKKSLESMEMKLDRLLKAMD